ncbi:hypothetical protein Rhe02_15660 [Rhizocola hellebori]|uniref:PrsW family intramembrane metalloprotease n=1 Tax=Rhizocola hellebori TaxID=1392758 RepID=A0A8J3Q4X1_9ACTN|nr:PrsW family glutamic-type intramembrane protease [Rhizocola hellebori]GIH03499.1 hypothetical protein Rhe02_15660 [Rhizocola hellebori]
MTLFMLIGACYGVWQLAVLSSWTRTVRLSALFLTVAVGLYGAGVLTVFLQLLYTNGVAAVTDTPLSEVVRTASYTMDPLIEEIVKVAPLALLVLLHKRIRAQWGLTDYVLVGAATGAGFTLAEAILRYSDEAYNVTGGPFSGWTEASGFSLTYFPGLPTILTSWVPAPVAFGDIFSGSAAVATNPHLVLSALGGLAVGLMFRGGKWILAGVGLMAYVWADHATFNYRVFKPEGAGLVGLLSGPFEFLNKADWLYPLIALGIASYLDYQRLKAGKLATADVATSVPLTSFATKGLPWTAMVAWRFALVRRNLYFAKAAGADTAELNEMVRSSRTQIDTWNSTEAWRCAKLPLTNPPGAGGIRAHWPVLVSLILLVPGLFIFAVGSIRLPSFIVDILVSPLMAPIVLVLSLVSLVWLAWQVVLTVRSLPQQRSVPIADPIARGDLRIINGCGAFAAGAIALFIALVGDGPHGPVFSPTHILDALGSSTALCILAIMFVAMALFLLFPGGGLALALGGLGGGGGMAPALAALVLVFGLGGLALGDGGGGGTDA